MIGTIKFYPQKIQTACNSDIKLGDHDIVNQKMCIVEPLWDVESYLVREEYITRGDSNKDVRSKSRNATKGKAKAGNSVKQKSTTWEQKDSLKKGRLVFLGVFWDVL